MMYLRGIQQIFIDMVMNPKIVETIRDRIISYFIEYNHRVFKAVDGEIDIFMMGDDIGAQTGPLLSLDMWRRYFKKAFKTYIDIAHQYGIPVMYHTCGDVRQFIPDFIECGLDILQSLQPKATNMDIKKLKQEFGKRHHLPGRNGHSARPAAGQARRCHGHGQVRPGFGQAGRRATSSARRTTSRSTRRSKTWSPCSRPTTSTANTDAHPLTAPLTIFQLRRGRMANDAAVGKNGSALTSDDRAQWQEWTKGYGHWRNQIFIVFWITYGAFYLCRVNFSVAIPDMMKEFGWSRSALGAVGTCLFWAYAVGQFTHGQISERFSSKHYLFTMMLLSALMNLLMIPAAGMGIAALGVVWALNGFFQAGGWPNCVKTLSQWFPPKARGKRMGLYGACYQFGNVMAWLLAGWAISPGRLARGLHLCPAHLRRDRLHPPADGQEPPRGRQSAADRNLRAAR